jgi:hypothetical protein
MPSNTSKRWWQSVTVWAGLFMLLNAAGLAGLNIDFATGDFSGNIYELWASVSGALAGIAAIYGRIRAATRIGR